MLRFLLPPISLSINNTRIHSTRAIHNSRILTMASTTTTPATYASASTATSDSKTETIRFPLSPVPPNPLGEGQYIRTAAALIIGDEILNGKTLDRNSNFFARYCFEQGIDLKRIEVVADDEEEIIEASRRMVKNYDFVITTGGIGPTHDGNPIYNVNSFQFSTDITYASLAKSFNQPLAHHAETLRRFGALGRFRKWNSQANPQQREAAQRMALFPEKAEVLFVTPDVWVPVVRLQGRLCVFPGIPSLFQRMLTELTPFLPLPPKNERPLRIQIFTDRPESFIAPYLTALQKRLKPHGVQVGSYPVLGKGVFVSLIGRDPCGKTEAGHTMWLADVAREVEEEVGGDVVSDEEVALKKAEAREAAAGKQN